MPEAATPRSFPRAIAWCLGLSLTGAAAVGPALAEAQVQSRLRERFGVDERFAIDLDLGGLELRGLSRALPGERGHVSAGHVRVRPTFDGLVIEIEELDGVVGRRQSKPAPPKSATPVTPAAKTDAPAPSPADPVAEFLQRFRGVRVELVTRGRLSVELADGVSATARDPHFVLSGDGQIHGDLDLDLGPSGGPTWTRAAIEVRAADSQPRELEVSGSLALGRSGEGHEPATADAELVFNGQISPRAVALDVHQGDEHGGSASVSVARGAGQDLVRVDADELPLKLLEPLALLFGHQLADALGERDAELDLDAAQLSGAVELERGSGRTLARFDAVELRGLRVDSSLIAGHPIELSSLTLDGQVGREHTESGPRNFGALVLGHGDVQLGVEAQLDADGVSLDLRLPRAPCQTVFDATPGISPVLAGTELSGELDAHIHLSIEFAALEQARARYLGADAEPLELETFEAPGELHFELPYLERCAVDRLGPGTDIEGLRGPYHHRFVSAGGRDKRRVLALGDDDYVRLSRVPKVALAFVILEDARFWTHDGFDREQIERAFWFNLLEGRVSRGASTISQQTARSLWLGNDRSVARKLAEAMLAAELERGLDKRRILEVYLNVIELGPEIHGIAEASRYHFGKEPGELELIEALHLASLAPAPVAYSRRFASGQIDQQWRQHLRRQVRRLRIRHLITAAEAEEAMRVSLDLQTH
ncbi:Penicillin-binding protein 1F [Enhygromyxa salina]|uniref:Penicillin-binding protein 1F n=1 Tax=Enhygromyxa salina TaxID=215803 RepID=A0A2S9XDX8_9BACT|nr:biosynthetic peptidoglycan transglycosylase [Enhygromyxa salina]PRP91064.1 Penicillin-binding protein 1F [Enhygromyxa salina]